MRVVNTLIILLLLVAGAAVAIILIKMLRHSQRINGYFTNAVRVYLWMEEEDAKIAALAASKVAAGKQRGSMLNHLDTLTSDSTKLLHAVPELQRLISKLSELQVEITAKDWTIKDIVQEKQRLMDYNPSYLSALEKADANVFVRKYPDLFKASNMLEIFEAAEKIHRKKLGNLVQLGEQLLKLKEFQDPECQKLIEKGIKQGKKDLENN